MSLGCALSLYKFSRNVILGSGILRHKLLLEPAQATDDFKIVLVSSGEFWMDSLPHPYVVGEDSGTRSIMVKSHPLVVPFADAPYFSLALYEHGATHAISPEAMKWTSPSQSLFSPPLRKVKICYRGFATVLYRTKGVNFGAIIEGSALLFGKHICRPKWFFKV